MSTPSRDEFVDQVISLVGAKFPLVKIGRADEGFGVRVNGNTASLENLFRIAQLRPEETKRQVERWMVELLRAAEGTPDAVGDFDAVHERILPMVVPDFGEASREAIVSQPLVEGLVVAYAIDHDRTISYVARSRFDEWHVGLDDLHAAAMANLVGRSESMNAHAAQDDDGKVYLILFQTMDGYDASRILLPTLHEKLRTYLGSPFAAAVPNRDILLCFRNDEETVDKLRPKIASDYQSMPHQITDKLFLVTADGIAARD